MIRVYIVEDHEMYLEGLTLLLQKYPGFEVAGTSKDGTSFLHALPSIDENVILLLDVHLPDTEPEELMMKVRELKPRMRIIFLTLMRGTRFIHKLMRYNIQGYLLKSATIEELLIAIRAVEEKTSHPCWYLQLQNQDTFEVTRLSLQDTSHGLRQYIPGSSI